MNKNKVTLQGNLGADPIFRSVQNGEVVNLSVGTTEKWKGKDGQQRSKTEWHKCYSFSRWIVDFCRQNLAKGHEVIIEGKIKYSSYACQECGKEGAKVAQVEILSIDRIHPRARQEDNTPPANAEDFNAFG